MSLKAFHLFFITISTALCFFLLLWGIWDYRATGAVFSLGLAALGVIGLLLLVPYFKWFRKKARDLSAALAVFFGSAVLAPSAAQACATCYTDPDSPLTKGAIVGVAVLGAIVVTVLGLIVAVARSWIKRARTLSLRF